MTISSIADAAGIRNEMRPFFIETSSAIALKLGADFDFMASSVFLIRLIYGYDIYAPPDEMAERLIVFVQSRLTYLAGPGGMNIPQFIPTGSVFFNDRHASFLSETAIAFVRDHGDVLSERDRSIYSA